MAFTKGQLCTRFVLGGANGKSHNAKIIGDDFYLYDTCIATRNAVVRVGEHTYHGCFIINHNGRTTATTKSYIGKLLNSFTTLRDEEYRYRYYTNKGKLYLYTCDTHGWQDTPIDSYTPLIFSAEGHLISILMGELI